MKDFEGEDKIYFSPLNEEQYKIFFEID